MNIIDQYVNQLHEEVAERYYDPEEQIIDAHAELAYAVDVENMPVEVATIIEEKVKEKIMNKKPVEKPINYSTPKEIAIAETEKKKETKTVNKKGKEVITPEIPKKYLDSQKLINNLWLYFKKHEVTQLNLGLHALTVIVQKVVPFSKHPEVTDLEFINWYMNDADMVAIAKHARKVLIDKKILRAGMLNGQYIGLVNIHGFKDEVKKCTK